MPIIATNKGGGGNYPQLEAGTYAARCYSMLYLGTIKSKIGDKEEMLQKIRIGWELATEMHEFKEGEGLKPMVISEEYTLSLNEKANLRKMLVSWRGKDFTDEEVEGFDVTKCLGAPCMITTFLKKSKDGKEYARVSGVSPVMKINGQLIKVAPLINPKTELNYDNFDFKLFESLPKFIQDKIKSSVEYNEMINALEHQNSAVAHSGLNMKDLPADTFNDSEEPAF